ncbi:hypothetical protein [Nocardioides albus]|uniref:DUF732 domain-containing protein n=1 Tax=Nocardioides albus TaxID=1841 RepID=A0A7W5F785_9ACTN|nr:hypothetical protein [Nocardioides albus]MBB3087910.1 hypothetical protein [Nocardioides albus]GGU21227.1 hypothetical protein GCM10007979_19770 [Nocardioides albus]
MKINVRRMASAVAVPLLLLATATACGGSESEEPNSKPAAEAEATETEAAETEATETEAAAEPSVPAVGDIPDPTNDPDGFEDYLTEMYVKAGMTDDQATCMSAAFMDNVDLDSITDPSSVSAMMGDEKLTEAMTKCV